MNIQRGKEEWGNKMKIPIIYEDSELLIINKPAGVKVHASGSKEEPDLTDWILQNHPELKGVGEPIETQNERKIFRSGIVHRIDKETSGVLIISKTENTLEYLKTEFKERNVQKTYNCFVYGEPSPARGKIDAPIARSPKDFRKKSTFLSAKGKKRDAVTEYKILKTNKKFSFLEVLPKTGRTHQIRVHLKSIGCPIICDPLYFLKSEKKILKKEGKCPLGFNRLALHARDISFRAPGGKKFMIDSDLPEDFEKALNQI